jgi:hydrogenase/urease accessory protein HupE
MIRSCLLMLATVLAISLAENAFAHEVRPGYLALRQTDAVTYSVLWKVPAVGDRRLSIHPKFPENCTPIAEPVNFEAAGSYNERVTLKCTGGIVGGSIAIDGLAATMTDVIVRLSRADNSVQTVRLTPSAPSFTVEAVPGQWEVAATYFKLGVEHILLGIDHLLFVLALIILVKGWRRLVGTITAFTVAHSITLAAATLGFVQVPGPPVEAVIALSIVFVAGEIVHRRRGRSGLTERWPWVVAFIFGLLHGLGFAGALNEVGLPQHAIPVALLFFNLGVEVGQLFFIGCILTVTARAVLVAKSQSQNGDIAKRAFAASDAVAAYIIGTVAAFWLVERTLGFLA